MPKFAFLVLSNPVEGREDEYNDWYDNQHLPDLVRLDGFVGAQRFLLADGDSPYKYMAIYDVDAQSPEAAMETMNKVRGTPDMPMSDSLDRNCLLKAFYRELAPKLTKD